MNSDLEQDGNNNIFQKKKKMTWFRTVYIIRRQFSRENNSGMTSGSFEIFAPLRYNITFVVSVIKTLYRIQIKYTFQMFQTFIMCVANGSLFKIS